MTTTLLHLLRQAVAEVLLVEVLPEAAEEASSLSIHYGIQPDQ